MRHLLFVLMFIASLTTLAAGEIQPALQQEMLTASGKLPVVVVLSQQADLAAISAQTRAMTRDARREFVVNELKEHASRTQAATLDVIDRLASRDEVSDVTSMWLINAIALDATTQAIETLAGAPGVDRVVTDAEVQVLDEREWADATTYEGGQREIAWNVTHVNADAVWAEGFTGEGVTVAVIDTGVNFNHLDLADHIWDGGPEFPMHGWDFHNDDESPFDDNGHGTHCAGTVAGDGTAGTQTGMAPDATIMCLKVLSSTGAGQESNSWLAMQFATEHGADIISMSLGWVYVNTPDRASWRTGMEAVLAAGLVASVAAGNEGDYMGWAPVPHNCRTPGDCPPPWTNPEQTLTGGHSAVVCVGAVNSGDLIAGFSSRGPCEWETVTAWGDYPYNPEIGLIRPDVCAPGVDITSLDYSGDTGYASGWDGTSMATPCVAGIMALMLQKNGNLTPQQIDEILEGSTNSVVPGKDNNYGAGRIDAWLAIDNTPSPESPPAPPVNPSPADGAQLVAAGTPLAWEDGVGPPSQGYFVYLGTDNPPSNVIDGVATAATSLQPADDLDDETTYYWRVNAWNEWGSTVGDVWSFTTSSTIDESFEWGEFELFPWYFDGDETWIVVEEDAADGLFCARAGTIGNMLSSSLLLDVYFIEPSAVAFYVKTSCQDEAGTDHLSFAVDGETLGQWCGETPWTQAAYLIAPGVHTLRWKYFKDFNTTMGEDTAWLDALIIPDHSREPMNLAAQVTDYDVQLTWEEPINPPNMTGYNVYRDDNLLATLDSDVFSYDDMDLASGLYSYVVSTVSNVSEFPAPPVEVEVWSANPPQNVVAEVTGEFEATLTWDAPALCEPHEVQRYIVSRMDTVLDTLAADDPLQLVDSDLPPGEYHYEVTAEWDGGATETANSNTISIVSTTPDAPPAVTALRGCTPNPFNPRTVVSFDLATPAHTRLEVYNILGQRVTTLLDEPLLAGEHSVEWRGVDDAGRPVASGVYLLRLRSGDYTGVQRALLLK